MAILTGFPPSNTISCGRITIGPKDLPNSGDGRDLCDGPNYNKIKIREFTDKVLSDKMMSCCQGDSDCSTENSCTSKGKAKDPPKWEYVYPHGTKDGDEEQKVFIVLARNPKYKWRSVAQMAKETGLSKERVEEILAKYWNKGMVFQDPKNDEHWGYWERVPDMVPKEKKSLARKDQDDRI